MLHFNAMYLKALYFVKNGLVQLDKEASSAKRAYYFVGKEKITESGDKFRISVSIDEHGKFNCEQCSGRWNGNLCSHVIALLLYKEKEIKY